MIDIHRRYSNPPPAPRQLSVIAESIKAEGFESLEEAQSVATALVRQIQDIDKSLGERSRPGLDGFPMSYGEFNEWRREALRTKDAKVFKLRLVKDWIRQQNVAESVTSPESRANPTTRGLLVIASRFLRTPDVWSMLTDDERNQVNEIVEHLRATDTTT